MSVDEQFSQTKDADQICFFCHNCEALYQEAVIPTLDALEMRSGEADGLLQTLKQDGITLPNDVQIEFQVLLSKLKRVRRVAGHYANAFKKIEQLGVEIPFPGAAAFAANIVYHELAFATKVLLATKMSPYVKRNAIMKVLSFLLPDEIPRAILDAVNDDLVAKVTYGNLLVFVEVYPIYTFCINHFQRFGVPRSEEDINDFHDCLTGFIDWWREANFGSGDDYVPTMLIDRYYLFRNAIIKGLRGDRRGSAMDIMINEQAFTLQDYMYDRMDWGLLPSGWWGIEIDDPFYFGTLFRDLKLVFAYEPAFGFDPRYGVKWTGGNVTEFEDRRVFTEQGVDVFINLYYETDQNYMQSQLDIIERHINHAF